MQLQWGTYFDAADQAGLSRLWGGIHVSADDFSGRIIGSKCGQEAWAMARKYFDGSVSKQPIPLATRALNTNGEIPFNTLRRFNYAPQSTPNVSKAVYE